MNAPVQIQGFILAKRPPVVGEVENFSYGTEKGRSGKDYIRIRRNGPDYGGSPFKVLAASPTGGQPDQHGNSGYNITLAATGEAPTPVQSPQGNTPASGDSHSGVNWGLALKLANYVLHQPGASVNVEEYVAAVADLATKFYPVVQAGPVPTQEPTVAQVEQVPAAAAVAPDPAQALPQQTTTDDDIPF